MDDTRVMDERPRMDKVVVLEALRPEDEVNEFGDEGFKYAGLQSFRCGIVSRH